MSSTSTDQHYDVIVIGSGNAGLSAASTAAQHGARVLVVEKAPEAEAGGNTYFTAGAYRACFAGLHDLLPLLWYQTQEADGKNGGEQLKKGLPEELVRKIDMVGYSEEDFQSDLVSVTKGRCDMDLARVLVKGSREALGWVAENGGGGKGLVEWHLELARKLGVEIRWRTPAVGLILDENGTGKVVGVEVIGEGGRRERIQARGGVVLACGGFQASPAMRCQYLGPGWDLAHVRGCKYSTGDGHRMAAVIGAQTAGNYSGCHSVAWDANSPRHGGDRGMTNQYTKSGYPLGLMLNVDGHRFVDEGIDLRNFTYAIFGKEILKQPAGLAFQVWDAESSKWLRKEEYADDVTTNIRADTLEQLAEKLIKQGLKNKEQFLDTIENYNAAVQQFRQENPDHKFDPAKKDGLSTQSSKTKLPLAKSNWALPIDKGPFTAVQVTTGVTFTFGGVAIDPETAVVISDATRQPIRGLYCVGELVGGLFWDNYPGGSGLTAGTVFGRIAGKCAAAAAKSAG